ncbi:MAG: sterol desaturase family protein [Verrucomicrobia bacterium]|nr:sterol desaturase family protein [Cytophagales bacterium]
METLFYFFIFIGSIAGMEIASWTIHKYILHGILWKIHKTHHQKNEGIFELNDLVSLFFTSMSLWLIFAGVKDFDWRFWMGSGIATYGTLYFILHDVLIHRRLKIFEQNRIPYLKAITTAHRLHHKYMNKKPSESFGLLWVSKKFFENKSSEKTLVSEK